MSNGVNSYTLQTFQWLVTIHSTANKLSTEIMPIHEMCPGCPMLPHCDLHFLLPTVWNLSGPAAALLSTSFCTTDCLNLLTSSYITEKAILWHQLQHCFWASDIINRNTDPKKYWWNNTSWFNSQNNAVSNIYILYSEFLSKLVRVWRVKAKNPRSAKVIAI